MDIPDYYRAPDGRGLFRVHASVAIVDAVGHVLLVQEAKQTAYGKWNLPGGHADHGESIVDAASRETLEETGLTVTPRGLVGVYTGPVSVRFVFRADAPPSEVATSGDEIMTVRWTPLDEILSSPNDLLVSPANLKAIAEDLNAHRDFPLHLLRTPRAPQ